MALYMKVDGATGSAEYSGGSVSGWSELQSFLIAFGNNNYWQEGVAAVQGAGNSWAADVSVTKVYDKASGHLVTLAIDKDQADTVIIRKIDSQDVISEEYTLSDVIVSRYVYESQGNGEADLETLVLSAAKVAYKSSSISDNLSAGNPSTMTFDYGTGKTT